MGLANGAMNFLFLTGFRSTISLIVHHAASGGAARQRAYAQPRSRSDPMVQALVSTKRQIDIDLYLAVAKQQLQCLNNVQGATCIVCSLLCTCERRLVHKIILKASV